MSRANFRPFVPKMGASRHHGLTVDSFLASLSEERVARRRAGIEEVLRTPYKGVTTDGEVMPGLFALRPEGAPTAAVVEAANGFLSRLNRDQLALACYGIDSKERIAWQNGIANPGTFGLPLVQSSVEVREAAMNVLRVSLSALGFERTRNVMKLNAFLGDLVGAPELMGEWNYFLQIDGKPSTTEPWGWQLYGHHLCVTCFILGEQMTLTPTFMGAEPRYADAGPHAGLVLFEDEERDGLKFIRSLSVAQQAKAIVYPTIDPAGVPAERIHWPDGMTLGGAYRDNAVVPYEGIAGADLDPAQCRALLDLAECYLATLPEGPLQARMADVERHIRETRFCWAGGLDDEGPFYYRIQSPIVMIEFDHHEGVVLTNDKPKRFHVHTVVRTPNGNDYGMDLLRLHYQNAPHHQHDHGHHSHDHKHD